MLIYIKQRIGDLDMKTLWKGAVSFGLVNIPVNMFAATEHKDIKFNYLHKECLGPIEYRKYCPRCQKEIKSDDIVRGYEYNKGSWVVIADEDLERIPTTNTKTVSVRGKCQGDGVVGNTLYLR